MPAQTGASAPCNRAPPAAHSAPSTVMTIAPVARARTRNAAATASPDRSTGVVAKSLEGCLPIIRILQAKSELENVDARRFFAAGFPVILYTPAGSLARRLLEICYRFS